MANLIAQSNVALAETLARALQGLRPSPVPTIKLGRFIGHPQRSGDPTLADWLDDFGVYARQMGVSEENRAVALFDHLGGCAKEEVLCHPHAMRQSVESLTALLRSRFGPMETVPSLHAAFHARMQLEGESLADYSRVLMRLHDRMEKAAATLCGGTGASPAQGQCTQGAVCSGSATTVSSSGAAKTCSGISWSPLLPDERRRAPLTSGGGRTLSQNASSHDRCRATTIHTMVPSPDF